MKDKLINKIRHLLHKEISYTIQVEDKNGCLHLSGELDNWEDIVRAGSLAVSKKHGGVVNDIKLKNYTSKTRVPSLRDNSLDCLTPDVMIIGAGVCGCAIARELSKYKIDILLVDKEYDVGLHASSRNDGDVHVGIDLKPNSLKHFYTSRSNPMFDRLSSELGFPFERTGHCIVFTKKWERLMVPMLKLRAMQLKIRDTKFIAPKDYHKIDPGLPKDSEGIFYMPSGGEICPYKFVIALAENAVQNGVNLSLNTYVESIELDGKEIVSVTTNRGVVRPRLVINCAGTFADIIADMAGDRTFTIHPRKGTAFILDKKVGRIAATSYNKSPFAKDKNQSDSKKHTKGGGLIHTVDGNVLVGPNACETPEREDFTTDQASIDEIFNKQQEMAPCMKKSDIITYFSGVRAPTYEEDFVVRKGIYTTNIIHAAGIQSPGLTAAPAIAVDIAEWAVEMLGGVKENFEFNPIRQPIIELKSLSPEDRDNYIKLNSDYGVIVCRCEEISKGEIIDALNTPIVVPCVDAVKRRVRPGMGRCQGAFCSPTVVQIISEHCNIKPSEVMKGGEDSKILYGKTK